MRFSIPRASIVVVVINSLSAEYLVIGTLRIVWNLRLRLQRTHSAHRSRSLECLVISPTAGHIGITRLCRGKKGNDISGRYALIGCRLVTKISLVEINPQRVFFREF